MNAKVSTALNKIIDLFKSGNVPKAVSIATYSKFIVPSNAWSLRKQNHYGDERYI